MKADLLLEYGTVSTAVTLHRSFLTIVTSTKKGLLRNVAAGLLINCFNSPVRLRWYTLITVDCNGVLIARRTIVELFTYLL